jgi:hypothetical protein
MPVESPHHADARHHGRAVELDDQEQGFYRRLPLSSSCSASGSFWIYCAASSRVTSRRPRGRGIGSSNGRFQPRLATAPRRADVGAAMVAHGAKHPGLLISKGQGHRIGKAASVDLSVVVTVRIAAVDEHVLTPVASHIRERNGLIVKQQVRDRPGPPEKLAPNLRLGNPLELAPWCQGTQTRNRRRGRNARAQ